jgi:hypothetical protein
MGGDLLFYTWGLGFSFVADGRRGFFNVDGRHFLLYLGGRFSFGAVVLLFLIGWLEDFLSRRGLSFVAGTHLSSLISLCT